jgi:hypothetical protein
MPRLGRDPKVELQAPVPFSTTTMLMDSYEWYVGCHDHAINALTSIPIDLPVACSGYTHGNGPFIRVSLASRLQEIVCTYRVSPFL